MTKDQIELTKRTIDTFSYSKSLKHLGPLFYTSWFGIDDVKYGGYKNITLKSLKGRSFVLENWDYAPGFNFLDEIHTGGNGTKRTYDVSELHERYKNQPHYETTDWPIFINFSGDFNDYLVIP